MKFMTPAKLSFMKMTIQLPFIYEKPLASTTNLLLLRLILACKLSGMLAKMPTTELCVLAFSFLRWVFSGVQRNITSKIELGLSSFEHIKSISQCPSKCINLLIRKLMNIHSLEEYMCDFYWLTETDGFGELEILYSHYTKSLVYETHNYLY